MGVLTEADVDQFASYCEAMATVRAMSADIQENGYTCRQVNKAGEPYTAKRPEVSIMNDAQRIAMQIGSRFGLTPSDRTRISVSKSDESDPFASLGAV